MFPDLTVQAFEFFEVPEGDLVVTSLTTRADGQVTVFGALVEIDVKIRRPSVFIIKIFIGLDVFGETLGLGPLPKDEPRTDERAFVNARALVTYRPEDSHL